MRVQRKFDREFRGVYIPAEIWLLPNSVMTWIEKLFLVEIHTLDRRVEGCTATNEHFESFFDLRRTRVKEIISKLLRDGWIESEIVQANKRVLRSNIKIVINGRMGSGNKPKYLELPDDVETYETNGADEEAPLVATPTPPRSENRPPPRSEKRPPPGRESDRPPVGKAAPHYMKRVTNEIHHGDTPTPTPGRAPSKGGGKAEGAKPDGVTPADIYNAYPRHEDREAAIKAIEGALKRLRAEGSPLNDNQPMENPSPWLLGRTRDYADFRAGEIKAGRSEKRFTPLCATWFNTKRGYNNDYDQEESPHGNSKPKHQHAAQYGDKPDQLTIFDPLAGGGKTGAGGAG